MKILLWMTSVCVYLSAAIPSSGAHPGDSYCPLQVGNHWNYQDSTKRTITDTLRIGGTLYYKWMETYFYNPDLIAIDTIRLDEGRVYVLHGGQEHLWFDFTLPDSASYSYMHVYAGSGDLEPWTVTVSRPIVKDTPAGTFRECIELFFDLPEVIDDEKWYVFAPGIGLVQLQYDGWGGPVLQSCSIGNSAIERPDPAAENPASFRIHGIYPNPFNHETRIVVESGDPALVSMRAYDTGGRLVREMPDMQLDAGRRAIPFKSDGLSSGVYFIQLQSGWQVLNERSVIIK